MGIKAQPAKRNGALHVLILVAGTTDPVNADDNKSSRAQSYPTLDSLDKNLAKNYWDQEFYNSLKEHVSKYVNFKLFHFHGWTGDNSIGNREIAGGYLVNRLCGAEGEKAFYEKTYQNKTIYFHLLGHSHGGNVMNEMTKQMDKLGDKWPKKWKIKSMTYLSTPFFNKLHQVKVNDKIFHKDAEVFHAFNQYDMTQRMLADFSMEPLAGILEILDTQDFMDEIFKLQQAVEAVPFHYLDITWSSVIHMSYENGLELYDATINMLIQFNKVLSKLYNLIKQLNREYAFFVDSSITNGSKKRLKSTRQMIQDDVLAQFKVLFNRLEKDVQAVITQLHYSVENNTQKDEFNKLSYVNDLFQSTSFIRHFCEFIDIDNDTLEPIGKPSFWGLFAKVLQNNIEIYDNTYANPVKQFRATFLSNKISALDVTQRDKYDNSIGSEHYKRFIKRIETVEDHYASDPSDKNLLDLLFLLLAQEKSIYDTLKRFTTTWIKYINMAEYIATGEVDKTLKALRMTMIHLDDVFDKHYFQGIQDERDINKQRGTLLYLLKESHSTSRRVLHPELKKFLTKVGPKL